MPAGLQGLDRYAYANNNPVNYTDPTGHFGKHRDDKSDYWNKRNQQKVKNLEAKWEKEKAEKGLKALVQATKKEEALDSDFAFADLGGVGGFRFSHANSSLNGPGEYFSCEPVDCMLSAVSLVASAVTLVPVPAIAGTAMGVDLVATFWALGRTGIDYLEGEVSKRRAIALGATGVLGLVPGEWGIAFSFANAVFTGSGQPQ